MPVPLSASSSTPTPMSYEKFKPKFPLDPFTSNEQTQNAQQARAPWTLDADTLPPQSALQLERRVILVIGQPTNTALAPLFASLHLASSLLIIASHRPPPLPLESQPAVHTLRLRTPLAVADAGASRLIEVFEWALQVARIWRRTGGPKRQELMEEVSPGPESVRLGQTFGRLRYSVAMDSQHGQPGPSQFSPSSSMSSLAVPTANKSFRHSLLRRRSTAPIEQDSVNVKPFDAILHFLQGDVPDKARLKATILVTTLSRPYLAVPPARIHSKSFYSDSSAKNSGKRWSFFRSTPSVASPASSVHSTSTLDLSDVPGSHRNSFSTVALLRTRRSRLLHLMPSAPTKPSSSLRIPVTRSNIIQGEAHLIRSMEAFLLSFCFSAPAGLPAPIAGFASSDTENTRARPYVLPSSALADILRVENEHDDEASEGTGDDVHRSERRKHHDDWTLAEIVLCGALEGEAETLRSSRPAGSVDGVQRVFDDSEKGKEVRADSDLDGSENGWMAFRTWIGSIHDVVVVRGSSSKTEENAQILPSRSSSQQQFPSLPDARSRLQSSRSSSMPQSLPHSRDHSAESHSQVQSQASFQARTMRNGNTTTDSTDISSSYVYPSKKGERKRRASAGVSLVFNKSLPTPPEEEDEDAEEETEKETVYATTPVATVHDVPVDNSRTVREDPRRRVPYSRSHPPSRSQTVPIDSHHSAADVRYRERTSSTHRPVYQESRSHPTSPSPTSPKPTYTRPTTPFRGSRPISDRRLHKPSRSSPHKHAVREDKRYHDAQKNYRPTGSLPTPPDSEEASLEGVPDNVPPASAPSRERKYRGAGSSRERQHERDEKGREWIKRDLYADDTRIDKRSQERERERERRYRAQSQPSRPSPDVLPRESEPLQRSKTKPEELPSKERVLRRTSEKRNLKVDAKAHPIRPGMERKLSSEERRGRRVPVPGMQDLLPPLPQQMTSSPARQSHAANLQVSPSSTSSHLHATSQKQGKWKFWKGDSGPVVSA